MDKGLLKVTLAGVLVVLMAGAAGCGTQPKATVGSGTNAPTDVNQSFFFCCLSS